MLCVHVYNMQDDSSVGKVTVNRKGKQVKREQGTVQQTQMQAPEFWKINGVSDEWCTGVGSAQVEN